MEPELIDRTRTLVFQVLNFLDSKSFTIPSSNSDSTILRAWPLKLSKKVEIDFSLYYGLPGIILFYLKSYSVLGRERDLMTASQGANYLALNLESFARDCGSGLYLGISGAGFALAELVI
jgi:hypothetical protein